MKRIVLSLLAVVLAIALGAWAWAFLREGPVNLTGPKGEVVVVNPSGLTGAYAGQGFGGRLVVDRNGCLSVFDEDDGRQRVAIWPRETAVTDSERLEIRLQGRNYRLGDEISVGGSALTRGQLPPNVQVPESCRGEKYLLILD
jgi:hypothetical protein